MEESYDVMKVLKVSSLLFRAFEENALSIADEKRVISIACELRKKLWQEDTFSKGFEIEQKLALIVDLIVAKFGELHNQALRDALSDAFTYGLVSGNRMSTEDNEDEIFTQLKNKWSGRAA